MTNNEMLKATSGKDTDVEDEPWPEENQIKITYVDVIEPEWPEDRVDVVGQNGNDGLVYEEEEGDA